MRAANWKDYELIDTGSGERLERWGDILLIRPDPQIIWKSEKKDPRWRSAHARYKRSSTGGGKWEVYKKLPDVWKITRGDLTFRLKPMGFKHTGVFPEQAVNWAWYQEKIKAAGRPIRVLNLFGYTGGATLACLAAGASVTHVDASKGMVAWARENAAASNLADRPCRWIVDDCVKFVQRETAAAAGTTPSSWTAELRPRPGRRNLEAGGQRLRPHHPDRAGPQRRSAVLCHQLLHRGSQPCGDGIHR